MTRWLKWAIPGTAALLLVATPLSWAQTNSVVSVYSIWVQFSLRGHSQGEIESLLRNMDPKTLEQVKDRLRQNVISNLRLKKIERQFQASRDTDDLNSVRESIATEIRFAGLQNDDELRFLIKEHFGIRFEKL